MKLQSTHAILDVKRGRKQLADNFLICPDQSKKIPVVITGYIDGIFGNDDGTSREFTVRVEKVEVSK